MKQGWKNYAPIALIIGILAGVATAAGYFVFGELNTFIQIGLSVTVLGLALYILIVPEKVMAAFTGRQARYGSNSLLLLIGVFGILMVANYLAAEYPQQWDVTLDQGNTLSPETLVILEELPAEVKILAFYAGAIPDNLYRLFESYKSESDQTVTYEFIDPQAFPLQAKEYGVTKNQTIVLEMGGRTEVLDFVFSEQELSAGLIRLMSESRTVYFVTGHGEYSIEEAGEASYALMVEYLSAKGYTLATLNLLSTGTIPLDADVLIIAGPQSAFAVDEVNMIAEYMSWGGSLIVLEEPTIFKDYEVTSDLLGAYLQDRWGIILGNDIIVDLRTEGLSNAVSDAYAANHPITAGITNLFTVYPTARSVQLGEELIEVQKTPLVFTAPFDASWAETDLDTLITEGTFEPDEDEDTLGPVTIAVAATNLTSDARLVVFGDSDFLATQYLAQFPGNADIFFNAVDWAAEQENLLNLTPREQTQRFVAVPFAYFGTFVALILIFLIPGMFVVAGVLVWYQRRRRL